MDPKQAQHPCSSNSGDASTDLAPYDNARLVIFLGDVSAGKRLRGKARFERDDVLGNILRIALEGVGPGSPELIVSEADWDGVIARDFQYGADYCLILPSTWHSDTAGKPTVHVIDSDPVSRRSIRRLLESDGLRVESSRTATEFLDKYDPEGHGCLVLEAHMPGMSGLDLQERLVAGGRCLSIIFVTDSGDVPTCVRAMKLGAVDFLEKPVNEQELLSLIRAAIDEDRRRCLLDRQRRETRLRLDRLTPREREVMAHMMKGKPAKRIAAELGIAHATALTHRVRVLQKLNVRSETELVRRFAGYSSELQ